MTLNRREVLKNSLAAGGVIAWGLNMPAFLSRTALQWSRTLDDAGVPNELVVESHDGAAMLHDDDNVRLGLVSTSDHPLLGELRQFGTLIGFSATPGVVGGAPPLAGQHSREILREAGYLDGDIDALVGAGVVREVGSEYGLPI